MHTYETKTFNIPTLDGISAKSIEEHLGLYAGYVKNFNAISQLTAALATQDADPSTPLGAGKNALAIAELVRRRSFEFDGMRLHEYYFAQFEGSSTSQTTSGPLAKVLESTYAPVAFEKVMTMIGSMRGPGWAVLYFDAEANELLTSFVGEQHQGHLAGLPVILALDVWEHAYILDYGAAGKGKYIGSFFKNLNWGVVEKRFAQVAG